MPSKNKSSKPSEAEIVFARASVTLAKHQRLIASWLPPKSEEVLERDRNGEGDEDEDADLNDYVGHELYVSDFVIVLTLWHLASSLILVIRMSPLNLMKSYDIRS